LGVISRILTGAWVRVSHASGGTMRQAFAQPLLCLLSLFALCGCASRPVNPRITQVHKSTGYRFETRHLNNHDKGNLVILAFSGGGTRAAAFSYGVLKFLHRAQVISADGTTSRLIDAVDVITGVSGGSFTALAYGLYGDRRCRGEFD
jgi:NTE family protein